MDRLRNPSSRSPRPINTPYLTRGFMVELQVNVFPNVILQNYLIHRHHGHCGLFDLWIPKSQPTTHCLGL